MRKKKKIQQPVPSAEEKPITVDCLIPRQIEENGRCSCGGYIHSVRGNTERFKICGDCNYMWSDNYEGYRYLRQKENLSDDERYVE